MATALHSRYLLTTDLTSQHVDARSQLTALETAEELGLETEPGIQDECLELYVSGTAEKIAELVERLDKAGAYVTWVTPQTDEEHELLQRRVGGLTEISEFY